MHVEYILMTVSQGCNLVILLINVQLFASEDIVCLSVCMFIPCLLIFVFVCLSSSLKFCYVNEVLKN